jgi:adenylosuccinate synthase
VPVSVVVGGQYGSEGKGKVAAFLARTRKASAVVRVGGPNSGHTPDQVGAKPLQQLPTAAYDGNAICIMPPGSYLRPDLVLREIRQTKLACELVKIDPAAFILTETDAEQERRSGLMERIGSTSSGTGAGVVRRALRSGSGPLASDIPELKPYLCQTSELMRSILDGGGRIVIEGTQGFGLSLLHSGAYPFTTSRDTTAAGALSETGLSPLDVDEVVLVIRAFPIRVAGNSGILPNEVDWSYIVSYGGHDHNIEELTTVTRRIRRVAEFDTVVVQNAIRVNRPTHIVMNHVDYVDHGACLSRKPTVKTEEYVHAIECRLNARIDAVGLGCDVFWSRESFSLQTQRAS